MRAVFLYVILAFTTFLLSAYICLAQNPPQSFTYRAEKAGVVFTVTADGLSAITLNGVTVAQGNWQLSNGEFFMGQGRQKLNPGAVQEKTLQVLADNHVRVVHTQQDFTTTYDYRCSEGDITIKARVENLHSSESLTIPAFSGLQFIWSTPPLGLLNCTHGSWSTTHPGALWHPGMNVKIGGTYAVDAKVGIGTSPANHTLLPTYTQWDYTDWSAGARETIPRRNLQYFVHVTIPPGGAETIGFAIRVSGNTDWKHLLQPYKDNFTRLLGPIRYKTDNRPMIQICANKSVQYITKENPYGYHDGFNRLDTAEGVKSFCDLLIPLLKDAHGQGVIIWGQQGTEPRGAEYRPDFDILPPETQAQWKTLQDKFAEAGLRLGVCTRPADIAVRSTWTQDGIININPDDPRHMEQLWQRFKKMIDMGCTLFYLDSFGTRPEDVQVMRYLREKMGPNIQTYSEMSSDAILPFSGLYMELTYAGGQVENDKFSIMWMNAHIWEIFRWLVPGSGSSVRTNCDNMPKGSTPADYYDWMLKRQLTPLQQVWMMQSGVPYLKELGPKYLDDQGNWKE